MWHKFLLSCSRQYLAAPGAPAAAPAPGGTRPGRGPAGPAHQRHRPGGHHVLHPGHPRPERALSPTGSWRSWATGSSARCWPITLTWPGSGPIPAATAGCSAWSGNFGAAIIGLVIILHGNDPEATLMAHLTGSPFIIGSAGSPLAFAYSARVEPPPDPLAHAIERRLDYCAAPGRRYRG